MMLQKTGKSRLVSAYQGLSPNRRCIRLSQLSVRKTQDIRAINKFAIEVRKRTSLADTT